jgi:hypothetical protein
LADPSDLLLNYPERARGNWFHHPRTTRDVAAEKLAEVTSGDGEQTCTLWKA